MHEDMWIVAWLHALSPFAGAGGVPMPYEVAVTFTPEAARKLEAMHEKVTVSAYYYADPMAKYESKTNEIGRIDLGDEQVTIEPVAQSVYLKGNLSKKTLKWVGDHPPMVNINVFSARQAGPDNILDCNFFEDTLTTAQAQAPVIKCGLIAP